MFLRADRRKLISNLLIGAGLLLILIAGFSLWWPAYQSQQLRAQLLQRPAQFLPAGTPAPAALILPVTPTATRAEPAETVIVNPALAAAPLQAPVASSTATPAATPTPHGSPTAGSSSTPLPTQTATATATQTPTPTATPIPASPPVRIVIPDLDMDVPIEEMRWQEVSTARGMVTEWDIPHNASGHAVNSRNLGEPGNVVLSGHNNVYGRVFMKISEAWGGTTTPFDETTLQSDILDGRRIEMYAADGRRFEYVVTGFYRVLDSGVPLEQRIANARWLEQTDEQLLTVTTCWPPWSNTHRLIVVAKPVS